MPLHTGQRASIIPIVSRMPQAGGPRCRAQGPSRREPVLLRSQLMAEGNVYPPSTSFVEHANVKGMEGYRALYDKAAAHPEEFWGDLARRELVWFRDWTHVFEW